MTLTHFIVTIINEETHSFKAKLDRQNSTGDKRRIIITDPHHNEAILWIVNNRFSSLELENDLTNNTVEMENLTQVEHWSHLLSVIAENTKIYQKTN